MDGENNGTPYFLMADLGGKPTIFGNIHIKAKLKQSKKESSQGFWRDAEYTLILEAIFP